MELGIWKEFFVLGIIKRWNSKKPLQELSDTLFLIYEILIKRFEQKIKS